MHGAALLLHSGQRVRLPDRCVLPHDEIDHPLPLERHHRRVKRGVTTPNDRDPIALVVTDARILIEHLFRVERLENRQLPRKVQEAHRENDLPTQIRAVARDHTLERVVLRDLIRVLDVHKLGVEAKLYEGVNRLTVHARRQLFPGHAIWKPGHIDDALVGVEELGLATRLVLRFDHQRGESAVGRGETGGQTGRPSANDDDVPVPQFFERRIGTERLDGEVGHYCTALSVTSKIRVALGGMLPCP